MIDFPAAPAAGQIFFASNGAVYQYSSTYTAWIQIASTVLQDGSFFATLASGVALTGSLVVQVPTTVLTGNAGGWYNVANGRYTPPAGRYYIFASLNCFNGGGSAGGMELRLRKNGSATDLDFASVSNLSGSAIHPTVWAEVDANGTDYFEILALTGASQGLISTVRFGAFPLSQAAAIPGGGSSWRQIASTVPTAAAAIDFQNFPSDINHIKGTFDVIPSTNTHDFCIQYYDGSGTLLTTSYSWATTVGAHTQNATAPVVAGSTGVGFSTMIPFDYPVANRVVGNVTGIRGEFQINNIRDASRLKTVTHQSVYVSDDATVVLVATGGGHRTAALQLTGLRFLFQPSVNFTAGGLITLWGSP